MGVVDGQGGKVPETLAGYPLTRMMERVDFLMEAGCEPTSALKEAASEAGIAFSTQTMRDFVAWGLQQMSD